MSLEIPASLDLLPQIQHRLHRLTSQLDQMQARLDQLTTGAQDNTIQLDALLQTMLTPHAVQAVDERLAELTVQLESTHEQIAQMRQEISNVATQEQVNSLERALAGRDLLTDVADSVKKLGRTQFKANTLGDTREQQIESALALARELVTRREQQQERRSADERLRLEEVRSMARGDLAADLLPALDSIELALDAGHSLLARHRQQAEEWRAHYAAMQRDWEATRNSITTGAPSSERSHAVKQPIGFWQRLRRNLAGKPPESSPAASPVEALTAPEISSPPPSPPAEFDLAVELLDATSSWLSGLGLVRDRFTALLAIEGIQPLPALGQPFDPRLHLAIEAEERSDAPANTVVRVLRQGYRQRQRVLRYAEVVVSRQPVKVEARISVQQVLEPEIEPNLEPDLEQYLETAVEQDLESDTEPDLKLDMEPDLEANMEPDLKPDLEPGTESDAEPNLEPNLESDLQLDLNPDMESDIEPDLKSDLEPDMEPHPESDTKPDMEPVLEPHLESDLKSDIESATEPDLKPDLESDIEPHLEPDTEPHLELGTEPDLEPNMEPKSNTEPDLESNMEPDLESDTEPDLESEVWNQTWNRKMEKSNEQF